MPSMNEKIRNYVNDLLQNRKVKGCLGLIRTHVHVRPYLFTHTDELQHLSLGDVDHHGDARYPLVKILTRLMRQNPFDTFAIVGRGCDERAIGKLVKSSQIDGNRLIMVGFSCPEELADRHGCLKPYPDCLVAGSKPDAGAGTEVVADTERNFIRDLKSITEWNDRCIKCYGCRNICPVCFCRECTLEEATHISQGTLPPDPDFLLTRAIHMVDYCVYCGLCEEACPADIPLTTIFKMVADIISEQHGHLIRGVPSRGDAERRGTLQRT